MGSRDRGRSHPFASRFPVERRAFLRSLAVVAGGGVLPSGCDWVPTRGLYNPCLDPQLPREIADHPVVAGALQGLDLTRFWDCHVHLVGTGDQQAPEVWVNPNLDSPLHPLQAAQKRLYLNASCAEDQEAADKAYVARLSMLLDSIPDMRVILLAFDYNYDKGGRRNLAHSTFYVSNAYTQAVAARHPRFEWACSVHPYREDAVEALEWSAARGARAVKWLPPAMGMDPSSPRCDPFYEAMRRLNLPLLTHGGYELAAQGGGHQDFGNPLLLRRALDHGVRVIVAHCASLGEGPDLRRPGKARPRVRNFSLFMDMMRDPAYEKLLYGDLSATTQINRAPEGLETLLTAQDIHDRLLNGSDYPLVGILPLFSPGQFKRLGLIDEDAAGVVFELQKYNPLLFDLVLKRNIAWQGRRFPARVFETARFFESTGTDL